MANVNDTFYKSDQTNPYKGRNKGIREKYDDLYDTYKNQQTEATNRNIDDTNEAASNDLHQQYISWMQANKDLPSQMSALGVSGSGAETTAGLRLRTNYENNRNATTTNRDKLVAQYRQALQDALTNKESELDALRDAEVEQNTQNYNQWNEQQGAREEERYANTISGWDSLDDIDREIARIERSGVDTWRIGYLRARRNELKALQEEQAAAGGGGYSSYGGYTYDTPVEEEETATATTPDVKNGQFLYTALTGNPNTKAKKTSKTTTKTTQTFGTPYRRPWVR